MTPIEGSNPSLSAKGVRKKCPLWWHTYTVTTTPVPPVPPSRDAVCARLRAIEAELRERNGVESLALFGSIARDDGSAGSDVDVLVHVCRPALSHFDLVAIKHVLEDHLGRSVDVMDAARLRPRTPYSALRPALRKAVVRDRHPVF